MQEELVIKPCTKKEFEDVKKLSLKCKLRAENGKIVETGISHEVEDEDFDTMIVAILGGRVVGCLKCYPVDEEDVEWFEIENPNGDVSIMKISVDSDFRGHGIAGKMIEYVKAQNPNSDIYVDILASPVQNTKSRRAFEKQGFILLEEKPWYSEELSMNTSWWNMVYKQK